MRQLAAALFVLALSCGCTTISPTDSNARELSSGGQLIGTLQDGREIRAYRVLYVYADGKATRTDYLYVISDPRAVSVVTGAVGSEDDTVSVLDTTQQEKKAEAEAKPEQIRPFDGR